MDETPTQTLAEFSALSLDEFEKMSQATVNTQIGCTNICEDCNINMAFNEFEHIYYCPNCNRINRLIGGSREQAEYDEKGQKFVTRRGFMQTQDHSKIQIKQTYEKLLKLNEKYTGVKIPVNILHRAATSYNDIQSTFADFGEKFVRRSDSSDVILGALIYYECIRAGNTRKKRDIATFCALREDGLSSGEDILKDFHARGIINIPIDTSTTRSYAERYLAILHLDNYEEQKKAGKHYADFVEDLVNMSIECKIGMRSVDSSKVVGAIWILIQHEKLNISINDVELACDNTRKNTFTNFSKCITENILQFIDVFEKNGIKHGYEGRLTKIKK